LVKKTNTQEPEFLKKRLNAIALHDYHHLQLAIAWVIASIMGFVRIKNKALNNCLKNLIIILSIQNKVENHNQFFLSAMLE